MGSEKDQFNIALKDHVIWNVTSASPSALCKQKYGWLGVSKDIENLSILLLPQSQVCRKDCCHKKEYNSTNPYIAHVTTVSNSGQILGNVSGKKAYALQIGLWFLRKDWKTNTGGTGADWLKQISNIC